MDIVSLDISSFQRRFKFKEFLICVVTLLFSLKYLSSFLTKLCSKTSQNDVYKRYRELPRPASVPIIGIPWRLLWKLRDGDIMSLSREAARKFGACYKINFFNIELVLLNSPEYVQALLTSNDYGHFAKGELEHNFWPEGIESITGYTGDKWRERRKMLSRSFTYKSLRKYLESFSKHSNKLVQEMEELFVDGNAHDISKNIRTCIFKKTCETLMGLDITKLEDGERQSEMFVDFIESFLVLNISRVFKPWQMIPGWFRLFQGREFNEHIQNMGQIAKRIIQHYKEKMLQEQQNVLLGNSKTSKDDDDEDANYTDDCMIETMLKNGVDDEKISHEVALLLGVANDTTSMAAEQLLFLLAVYPEHQRRCQEEVDKVFNDHDGILDSNAVTELKYLERCILEEQRVYPLTVLIMRKIETPLKLEEGLVIPPGTNACYMGHALHYDPVSFPDPDKYDPDRFLPDEIKKRHPYAYTPFSGGPRNCIGMKLAITELKILIATILHTFNVSTLQKREDMKLINYMGVTRFDKPVELIFKRRESRYH